MSYLAPLVPVAAQAAQWAWGRYSKRVEQEERVVAVQMPQMPKPPTLDELRQRFGPQNPPQMPRLPSLQGAIPQERTTGDSSAATPFRVSLPSDEKTSALRGSYEGRFLPTSAPTSYSDTFDTSVACLPCTRGHVSAMAVAAERVVAATERGDTEAAKKNLARLAGEAVVMERFDWTAEKMERATDEDRAIIQHVMPQVRALVEEAPTAPLEVVGAWSSVDESLRFARSTRPTAKDAAEIHERVSVSEGLANYAEREVLSPSNVDTLLPEQRRAARDALNHMRVGRHTLTDADALDLPTLELVSTQLERATVLLTPTPTPEQAREIAARAKAVKRSLDDAIRAKMMGQVRAAAE